jgi:hypothetical protein
MDKGDFIDLVDSDDDLETTKPAAAPKKPALVSTAKKVKAEPSYRHERPTPSATTAGYARIPVTPYERFSF